MTATSTPTAPPDAAKLAPKGAEGLTYAIHLVGRDDVQSWSEPTSEWLDGANGAYEGDTTAMVWWRHTPGPLPGGLTQDDLSYAASALFDLASEFDGVESARGRANRLRVTARRLSAVAEMELAS